MTERLVVVGGDAAGMTAASQAKRLRGDDLEVVVLERGSFTSYSACGIPYWVAGDVGGADELVVRTPEEHRRRGIDVRLQARATALDLDAGRVEVAGQPPVGFDRLLLATGATPTRPEVPGLDARNVFGVQTLGDGVRLIERLRDKAAGALRAVVLGAGYIGIEMAEALVRHGYRVTMVTRSSQPMTTLDPELGRLVAQEMADLGIDVRCDSEIEEVLTDRAGSATAVRAGGATYPADVVVLGIGVQPAADLARDAKLPLGDSGGIRVDSGMQVEGYDVLWAAGDCVESWDRVARRWVHLPLGTHANKQGLVAGRRIAGRGIGGRGIGGRGAGDITFPGVLKTAMTKVCGVEVARTGLGEAEAAWLGLQPATATIEATTRSGYLPDARPMTVKMLADRSDGRLLGAQIVGGHGSAIRIDTCATALWAEMTVEQVIMSDLGYAPPLSPLWDPVQVAARALLARG